MFIINFMPLNRQIPLEKGAGELNSLFENSIFLTFSPGGNGYLIKLKLIAKYNRCIYFK